MRSRRLGLAVIVGVGVLALMMCCAANAGEIKVQRTISGSSSDGFSLYGWHNDSISISGAPSGATVQGITVRIQGSCAYGNYLAFDLTDASDVHSYSIETGWWEDEMWLDETAYITALNGLPVNQNWVLWGMSYAGVSGEYVDQWSITITYDDGVVLKPDLAVQTSNCTPLSLRTGEPLSLSATIANQGNKASTASKATWYIATHATPATTDPVLAAKDVAIINNSATSAITASASAPTIPGTYYVAVKADSGGTNTESNEDNNWGSVFTVTVRPQNVITISPAHFIEEGTRVTMTAPTGSGYIWKKGGIQMTNDAPRVVGVDTQQLVLDTAIEADSGVYSCTYDDGTKAVVTTEPRTLTVFPVGSVPVGGPCALAILAALLGGIGMARGRRS